MKKVLRIAWKDLIIVFRDPAALIMMLLTPFALTLAIAFAFGGLGGSSGGLADIPLVVVNHDGGEFGDYLVQTFQSDALADLLEPLIIDDDTTARAAVDADEAAAAVIIPADFSAHIVPTGPDGSGASGAAERGQSVIEVRTNPLRPISAGVVRGIVDDFVSRVAAGAAGGEVAVVQLAMNGLLSPQQLQSQGQVIGQRAGQQAVDADLITVRAETASEEDQQGRFNWLGYMAPSMAIMFLMFTVTAGARSILAERDNGTLPRMLVSPTSAAQVIGGKVLGIYLTGVAQLAILILASALLFGVVWGSSLAVVLVVLALVAAATAWGVLLAAYARTPGQANAVGTALALVFGALAGNFMPRQALPQWVRMLSFVSPNAWGLEAFTELSSGGALPDVLLPIVALLAMALVLFVVATLIFRRQYK